MNYWLLFLQLFLMSIVYVLPEIADAELRTIRDRTGPHGVSILPVIITVPPFFLAVATGIDFFRPGWGPTAVLVVNGALAAHSLFITSEIKHQIRALKAKRSEAP